MPGKLPQGPVRHVHMHANKRRQTPRFQSVPSTAARRDSAPFPVLSGSRSERRGKREAGTERQHGDGKVVFQQEIK